MRLVPKAWHTETGICSIRGGPHTLHERTDWAAIVAEPSPAPHA